MHHEDIKAGLRKKDCSLAKIARSLKVSRTAVTDTSKNGQRSQRIEKAIADALGKRPEQIWPSRYKAKR